MFLLIYVLDSVSFVMFVCLSSYSLLPDLWWIKLFKAKCQVVPIWATTLVPYRPTARQWARRLIIGLVGVNIELSETCRRCISSPWCHIADEQPVPDANERHTGRETISTASPILSLLRDLRALISHNRTTNVNKNVITLLKPRRILDLLWSYYLPLNIPSLMRFS